MAKLLLAGVLSLAVFIETPLALVTCPAVGQCPNTPNAQCPVAGSPCVCNTGFHENADSTACLQDLVPGALCTIKDAATECVDGAVCINVASEDQAERLQCMCSDGYESRANVGAVPSCKKVPGRECTTEGSTDECVPESTCRQVTLTPEGGAGLRCDCNEGLHLMEVEGVMKCQPDVQPGGACTLPGNATECVDGATCAHQDNTSVCTCNADFHSVTVGNTVSCKPDIAPGSPCTMQGGEECVENAVCQNTAAAGVPATLVCVCPDVGFHVKMEGSTSSCQPDLQPGGNCSKVDDSSECVGNATCVNVTPEETVNATLQCTCDTGFHLMKDEASGAVSCQPDVNVGGVCKLNGSDVECVEGAQCMLGVQGDNVTGLVCSCKPEYHQAGQPPYCEKDKTPGSTCVSAGSQECVQHAQCSNMAAEGQPDSLQCQCMEGYHVKDSLTCQQDIGAGESCTQENSTEECVDHATCLTITIETSPEQTELKCKCDEHHHMNKDNSSKSICAEDTCQHTRDKCISAGVSSCGEVNAFMGCMLSGKCDPNDDKEVGQFNAAMMEARGHLQSDCSFSANSTCVEKIGSCLGSYLKMPGTCSSIIALSNCLTKLQTDCQGDNALSLATKFREHVFQNLSCECVEAANACYDPLATNFNAEAADNTSKCSAAKALFSCAVGTEQCNASLAIDHKVLSGLWATARNWSAITGCKDSLTEADATSCQLQLTRCALIFSDDYMAVDHNKTASCRITERFGECLAQNTALCAESNMAAKSLFAEQYSLASSTCLCVTKVTDCLDAVGQLTNDPLDVCPKMESLGKCLLAAKCHRANDADDINILNSAHDLYTQHVTNSSCKATSSSTCSSDIGVCADTVIRRLTVVTSAAEQCSAITDSLLCVNAANCSGDITSESVMMMSVREASVYKLQSLACVAPSCNGTMDGLTQCKVGYEANFTAAGSDNTLKCKAKNDMVRCLRVFRCNTHMNDNIQQKYDALRRVVVPDCELISLNDDDSSRTNSVQASLITVLLVWLVCSTLAHV